MHLHIFCANIQMRYTIDIPDVRQHSDFTCGPAALEAILTYYGFPYREKRLAKMLHTTRKHGTNPMQIALLCAEQFGLAIHIYEPMTFMEIRTYIKSGIPILVVYQSGIISKPLEEWNSGHYAIIIGIDGDKLILEDPAIFGRVRISMAEFAQRWHDIDANGRVYNHFAIVIFPPSQPNNYKHSCAIL